MKFISSCLVLLFVAQRALGLVCPEGFIDDNTGSETVCSPIQNYQKAYKGPGDACETSSECDGTKNFECLQGTCQCNPTTSVLQDRIYQNANGDHVKGVICSIKVGGSCGSPSQRCVTGAVCNITVGSICTCLAQFTETSENLCGKPYGSPCDDNQVCSDGFICSVDNGHNLLHPYGAAAYPSRAQSAIFIHTSTNPHHMKKRSFPAPAERNIGTGYVSDGVPVTAHHQSAGHLKRVVLKNARAAGQAVKGQLSLVAAKWGFTVTGVCHCNMKYHFYDPATKTCRSVIGSPCDTTKANASSQCVERGVCMQETGVCECENGFVETLDGHCDIAYDQKCDQTHAMEYLARLRQGQHVPVCDKAAHLLCKKGKCACSDEMDVYDAEKRECTAKKGARCLSDEGCLTGMKCVRKNWKTYGRCLSES